MLEWAWDFLVQQRIDRLRAGNIHYADVIFLLTIVGGCIIAFNATLRRIGSKQEADEWERGVRETAEMAEREGRHGVREWHRKFGYVGTGSPSIVGWVFIAFMVLLFGWLYVATR